MSPFPLFTLLWMMYGWEQVCGCHFSPYTLTPLPAHWVLVAWLGLMGPGVLSLCKMWSPASIFLMVGSKSIWCIRFLPASVFGESTTDPAMALTQRLDDEVNTLSHKRFLGCQIRWVWSNSSQSTTTWVNAHEGCYWFNRTLLWPPWPSALFMWLFCVCVCVCVF